MNLLRNFYDRQSDYFAKNEEYVARKNRYSLYRVSYSTTIIFLFFLCFTPVIYREFKPGMEYWISLVLLFLFAVFSRYLRKRTDLSFMVTQRICAFFYIYMLAIMLLIDVIPPRNTHALFFPIVIAVLPAIFIMRYEAYLLLTAMMETIFIVLEITQKSGEALPDNLFISTVGSILALIVGWILLETRIEDGADKSILVQRSQIDHLTGVKNKATCEHEILHYLSSDRGNMLSAYFLLDVDHFKSINDQFGHQYGDEILARFGALLNRTFRASDIIGRTGGDEFTVFVKDLIYPDSVDTRCKEILSAVHAIRMPDGNSLSCSIGVAICQSDDYTSISKLADDAMYEAKLLGKDRYVRFLEKNMPADLNKKIILIADDDPGTRAAIRTCFDGEYECLEATNGNEVLNLLSQYHERIAAILLDIYMPEMSGYEVLDYINRRHQYTNIPILVITADKESEVQALQYGAVDMITKPINPSVLKLRVKKVLN